MNFFTEVDVSVSDFKIDYTKNLLFVGSCFAQNISQKFLELKFAVLVNPFGTIYNPLSIRQMFENILNGKRYTEKDVFCDRGMWSCWDAHSSLSGQSQEECLSNLNRAVSDSAEFLKKTDVAFITLGTAFVYFLKNDGSIVSNCHRRDASLFERRLISVEETVEALERMVELLRKQNAKIQIVFTVSPLRHLNDGAHGNQLSKSTLLLAVDQIVSKHSEFVSYFPSYEIVLDELRDYRFYDCDMVHLSDVAEEFIFEKMEQTYFDNRTLENCERVKKFMKAANHKVGNANSLENKAFAEKYSRLSQELMAQIPGLNLQKEAEQFESLQNDDKKNL